MGRSVLLLHEVGTGAGGSHYDWLIERAPGGSLISFRVTERIDRATVGEFEAERIGDHRAEYLTYEGPVSGGRGTVRRVAEGELTVEADAGGAIVLRGRIGEAKGVFSGVGAGARWRFRVFADA